MSSITSMFRKAGVFWLSVVALFICFSMTALAAHFEEANNSGFYLKKVVSDTVIQSGQPFSYTIFYSIPVGATNITITDVVSNKLIIDSYTLTSPCGAPTILSPLVVGNAGGTYSFNYATSPSGCSGSFTISAHFPNGTTCNGDSVLNRVCLTGTIAGKVIDLCTRDVKTFATAINPWGVGKYVVGAGYQGGACPYAIGDSVVTYQICYWKTVGIVGQMNLNNPVIKDTLPAGATLQSSTCGATQSGNVITWTVTPNPLVATSMYTSGCCQISVLYPRALFPTGSTIQNKCWLSGSLGGSQSPCGNTNLVSNTTCVEIKPLTSGTLGKYVSTNGQPGCPGSYSIWVCNNGNTNLTGVVITDTLPSSISGYLITGSSAGFTPTLSGNILTVTSTAIPPGQCRYVSISFNIPASAIPGTTITNCASMTYGTPTTTLRSCASFVVNAPAPKPCLWKEVCAKQPNYSPGATFKYRLRVQNVGGQAIPAGTTITDILDPNLQWVGPAMYYSSTAYNAPCGGAGSTTWTGVTSNVVGQTITFTLPTISAQCQNIFYTNCGQYGTNGVPFYFIEFDVKVRDSSAIGNIPNSFTIAGAGFPSSSSNVDYVNVVGTGAFTMAKEVSKDNGTTYASSVSVAPGAGVQFRLRVAPAAGSVALRYVTFADLIPRDFGTSDRLILGPGTNRGSAFDIAFVGTISTTPASQSYYDILNIGWANVSTVNVPPVGFMFIGAGSGVASWSNLIVPANAKNFGYKYGATAVANPSTADAIFSGTVPSSALHSQISCNTFAANAAVKFIINSTTTSWQKIGQLESQTACVTVDTTAVAGSCIKMTLTSIVSAGANTAGNCVYTVTVAVTNPNGTPTPVQVNSAQGTVTPINFTAPVGTSTQVFTFTDTPPTNSFACIRYGTFINQQFRLCDSFCFDLAPCNQGTGKCLDSLKFDIKCTGQDAAGNFQYAVSYTVNNVSGSAGTLVATSPTGTVSPSTFVCPTGTQTLNFVYTDVAPVSNPSTIYFTLVVNGAKMCRDTLQFGLPPCPPVVIDECCAKFIHKLNQTSVSYFNDIVSFSTGMIAGPAPIKRFSATLVSVQRRQVCMSPTGALIAGPWERSFGDITAGLLSVAPAPGPQLLNLFSRSAEWGPGNCIDWNNGATLRLRMIFPKPPCKPCFDTLRFAIRFSFTDCNCVTCDTTVFYTIVRKCTVTPWDNADVNSGRTGIEDKGNVVQAAETATVLEMATPTNGTLTIANNKPENEPGITITGVLVRSLKVPLTALSSGTSQGAIVDEMGYLDREVLSGDISVVNLTFDNAKPESQFPVGVVFAYTLVGSKEVLFSPERMFTARIPSTIADVAGIDAQTKPAGVRTYAVYFENRNSNGDPIAAVAIKLGVASKAQVIAVGPTGFSGQVTIQPRKTETGAWVVNAISEGYPASINRGETMKPIFITVSGVTGTDQAIEFSTLDANGEVISRGTTTLSSPISRVEDSNDGSLSMSSVAPNPSSGTSTVTVSTDRTIFESQLVVANVEGQIVRTVFAEKTLEAGNHIVQLSDLGLASGAYQLLLRSSVGTAHQSFVIVK